MKFIKNNLLILLVAVFLAACGGNAESEPAASDDTENMEEMEHDDDDMEGMEHDDMENMEHDDDNMEDDVSRVPNDGAVIRITSPSASDSFNVGDQVIVEVEVDNFDLGSGENHWHVYIDGASWGMVMGGNTDQPLTGLESGEHEISVYLSIDTHEEMEDGDAILITINE